MLDLTVNPKALRRRIARVRGWRWGVGLVGAMRHGEVGVLLTGDGRGER